MTEFTKEYIYKVRVYSTLIDEPASEVIEECLDEVERLQAQLEVERPTGICEICTSTVIKENARLRGEKERLSVTMKLIKDRGLKHGVEWCVATASGALESEGG